MKKLTGLLLLLLPLAGIAQERSLAQAITLQEQGIYEEAKIIFGELVSEDEFNHEALYYLGICEFHLDNYDSAEKCFRSAIGIQPELSDYYLWLGNTYKAKLQSSSFFEKGILAGKTLDNYKKAVKIEPANLEARIALANYYIHAPSIGGGSVSKAKEQVEEIKKYNLLQAAMLMAEIYANEENYDAAIEEYKHIIELESRNVNAYYRLGMLYQSLNRYEEATDMFEMAISMDEHEFASLYQIGRTSTFSGENIARGIECMKAYIKANPGSPYPSVDAAHWRLGMLYELQGKSERALNEYETALAMNPGEKKYMEAIEKLQ